MQIFLNKLSKVFNQVKKYYNELRKCKKRGENWEEQGLQGSQGAGIDSEIVIFTEGFL